MAFRPVLPQDGPSGDFLGALAVPAGLLGLGEDAFVLALLSVAHPA
jgi:hypothetical protein